MRVLQVVGKMNIGGAEQLLMNVYRNIDREKFQFDFLTFYDEGEKGFFDDEIVSFGGNIINIPKPSKFNVIKNIKSVCEVLKSNKYDAIHTHIGPNCAYALLAAKICKVPIRIAHSHNSMRNDENIVYKLVNNILRFVSNVTLTRCCACSEDAARARYSKKNRKNKYIYVPNAVDFEKYLIEYDIQGIKKSLNIPSSRKILLQVGNFREPKNQLFSVEIAKRMKETTDMDFCLLFAGRYETEYGMLVQQKIKEYNLQENIILLGQRTDIPELMSISNVMLMPSVFEGLGIVLLEAQSSGLPCIVSEAIPPEANMNIGIFNVCKLDDLDLWIEYVKESFVQSKLTIDERKKAVNKSVFKLDYTVNIFNSLYTLS